MTTTLSVRIDTRYQEASRGARETFWALEVVPRSRGHRRLRWGGKLAARWDSGWHHGVRWRPGCSAQGPDELALFVGSQARTEGASRVTIVWPPGPWTP